MVPSIYTELNRRSKEMSTSEKRLMKGNEAFAIAAIRSGCRFYFGYPITPQNEIPEYMSRELSKVGGSFIQAESELVIICLGRLDRSDSRTASHNI